MGYSRLIGIRVAALNKEFKQRKLNYRAEDPEGARYAHYSGWNREPPQDSSHVQGFNIIRFNTISRVKHYVGLVHFGGLNTFTASSTNPLPKPTVILNQANAGHLYRLVTETLPGADVHFSKRTPLVSNVYDDIEIKPKRATFAVRRLLGMKSRH